MGRRPETTWTFRALRALARAALALYYRGVEVHGRERIPREGRS